MTALEVYTINCYRRTQPLWNRLEDLRREEDMKTQQRERRQTFVLSRRRIIRSESWRKKVIGPAKGIRRSFAALDRDPCNDVMKILYSCLDT